MRPRRQQSNARRSRWNEASAAGWGPFPLVGLIFMQKHWDNPVANTMPAGVQVPAVLNIGGVRIAPATVLAPMAGVTDTVFRRFIKNASKFSPDVAGSAAAGDVDASTTNEQSGCGLIMTEFTSADGLSRMRETKRKRYLTYYDDEHPISAQIFGSNPETLADSARICQDAGFDLRGFELLAARQSGS